MKRGRPILVADDDAELRETLAAALRDSGYDVREAATGDEAIRLARLEDPLLVLLDIRMPGLCGYEVCRTLREEFGNALPIVFMSGERTDQIDRVGGLIIGADDYLAKPFGLDELYARVRRITQRVRPLSDTVAGKLTDRELEILRLLALGMSPAEIAAQLSISRKTVATHTEHIFLKLGVQSRAQAIAIAYRDEILQPSSSGPLPRASVGASARAKRR
jgi:DNA-binding NarL/FixJ family response regulator